MSSLSLQQWFRSPFVLQLLTLLQWILLYRRTIHGLTIDKQLDCQPTDNGDIVCSFRIVSSQMDNPPADTDTEDDSDDDTIKQFLTTCVDDVCMYTHVTVRKTKPIIKKEIHNNNHNRNRNNHNNNWNENKNKRQTNEQKNDEHDDDDEDDDDDDDNDIRPVTHSHQRQNQQNESVLHIGSASYHPPYQNYGSKVQAVLKRHPRYDNQNNHNHNNINYYDDNYDDMTKDQPWATFFIQLGNAHLIDVQRETDTTTSITSSSTSTLYHAELARNAYQQALKELETQQQKHQEQPENINTNTQQQQQQQLQKQEQYSSIFPNVVKELTATVHFQLGEAYSITDTEQAKLHQETALELYRQLRRDYSDLLQRKKNTTTTNSQSSTTTTTTTTTTITNTLQIQLRLAAMDKSYADTCTKLGMSIHNRAVETSNQSQMSVMVNGLNAAGTGTDGGAGTASINLQDGLGAGYASFGNDFFVEDNNMMSIESLLQMMQQMNNPQTQMELEEQLQHAADYLDEAILIYEQHLVVPHGSSGNKNNNNNKYNYNSHHDDWYLGQAMAYQQAATIATTQNQLVRAQPFLQKALDVYLQKVLPKMSTSDSVSDTGVVTAIGNLYVSLANTHLQLGQYDLAKTTYSASMDWHRNHRRIPTATFAAYDDTSTLEETLTLYRHQLEEYRRLLNGDGMYYMPRDDTYEGDLLSAMGSLYLNQGGGGNGEEEGDDDEALQRGMDLLRQALELYNKAGGNTSRSSKKTKRSMADTQLNLAMAYFRKRDFDKSIQSHFAALDIYRELYGDGTNPLTRGLEDVEELLQQAGMGDYAEQLKGWIQGSGDSDDGKPSVTVDLEKFQQSSQLRQNVTVEAIPVNRDQNEESTESTEQNTNVQEGEL